VNDDVTVALFALAFAGGLALLIWVGIVLVKAAKRGGGGMRAIGAGFLMMGWATMRDPRNDTVAETQDGRIRKGTHSGEPLDSNDHPNLRNS
jgi:hypothetical protein